MRIDRFALVLAAGVLAVAPAMAHDCGYDHDCQHHSHCGSGCGDCGRYQTGAAQASPDAAARIETLRGKVTEINYLPATDPAGATLELRFDTGAGSVVVRTAPLAFLKRNSFTLKEGDSLSVRGYKATGTDGDVVVATEIEKSGRTLVLRSDRGRPVWW